MAHHEDYKIVQIGATVFKVFAWVALVVQVILGVTVLIFGGPDMEVAGVAVPARLVGLLNCISAGIQYFLFLLISAVIRLLLDLHAHVTRSGTTS